MTPPAPYPYSFMLRLAHQTASSNVGYICKPFHGNGPPWAEQLFSAIPNRLSAGVPDLNDQSNVSFYAWENIANGGVGAFDASDSSRVRWSLGMYTGDQGEMYLQPAATEFTKLNSALPAGQVIKGVIPWYIPSAQQASGTLVAGLALTASSGGSLADSLTYGYQVTGMTGSVESTPCAEITVALAAGQHSVHINWTVPTGTTFTSYRVYRAVGVANVDKKQYFEIPGTTAYTDSVSTYRLIDNGTTTAGKTISAGSSALAATPIRKVIVLADDGTNTYLYELPFSGTGSAGATTTIGTTVDVLRQTMLTTGTLGISTKGLTDAAGAAIADNTLVTSISGTLSYNACTLYYDHLIIPTTNTAGTQVIRHIYYDSNATNPGLQISDLAGQIGHRVFGEMTTRLWVFKNNLAYWCSEPYIDKPTWNGPIPVGDRNTMISSAIMHGGTMINDAALYLAKADGLFRILDTDQGPQTRAETVGALGMVDDANGSFMCNHRGELYIGGRHVIFRYTIGQMDNSGPNKLLGLCPSLQMAFYDGVSTGRHFLALGSHLNNATTGPAVMQQPDPLTGVAFVPYGYQQIYETSQGEAWAQVHHSAEWTTFSETQAPVGSRWTGRTLELVTTNVANDWHASMVFSGGDTGNRLFRLPVRNHDERYREAPAYTPIAHANVRLPAYFTEHAHLLKLWQWIEVNQSGLTNAPASRLQVVARLYTRDRQPDSILANVTYNSNVVADTNGRWYPNKDALLTNAALDPIYPLSIVRNGDGTTAVGTIRTNTHRQYLLYAARADGTPWVGNGIEIDVSMAVGSDARTPVISSIVATSSEAGTALHRWTFPCELALGESLADGQLGLISQAALNAAVTQLFVFAQNKETVILTDPYGVEYPVRVDLSPFTWQKWQQLQDGIHPQAASVQMTITQLFVN